MSAPETSPKKGKYKYVQDERDAQGRLLAKGTLKKGLKIGDVVHKEFVLHEALTGDLMDAEQEFTTDKPLSFNTVLLRYQLVKIGTFDGAVTVEMLRNMKSVDTAIMREAQAEFDIAGEAEQ